MIHLTSAHLRSLPDDQQGQFPFRVPAIADLVGKSLAFDAPVTLFVGENGSGKSTLLEGIAAAARAIAVGSADLGADHTLGAAHTLARALRLAWARRTHRGFFLRAEDFFGYAQRMQAMREEHTAALAAIDADPTLSAFTRAQARMPHANSLAAINVRYGAGLDSVSHGESFFALFRSRFVPNGLYLLDEPEAPLSPLRQLALLAMIKEQVEQQQAQFIIATHSPILLAYPDAQIYSFDNGMIAPASYETLEHVTFMRDFLANPQRFLRHL
jgi:predicted ATPase